MNDTKTNQTITIIGSQEDFIVSGRDTIANKGKEKKTKSPNTKKKLVKKILILSANPINPRHQSFDKEISDIQKCIQQSKNRDLFDVKVELAVDFRDFGKALSECNPQVVHFIGHGEKDGLMVEGELGYAVPISPDVLTRLFEHSSNKVECVILGACHSAPQADAISQYVDYVIGMQGEIKDQAAHEFVIGFYNALGAGKSVEESFESGRTAILQVFRNGQEHLVPVMKKKKE